MFTKSGSQGIDFVNKLNIKRIGMQLNDKDHVSCV